MTLDLEEVWAPEFQPLYDHSSWQMVKKKFYFIGFTLMRKIGICDPLQKIGKSSLHRLCGWYVCLRLSSLANNVLSAHIAICIKAPFRTEMFLQRGRHPRFFPFAIVYGLSLAQARFPGYEV